MTQVVQTDTFRGVKGLCGTRRVPHQDARAVHEVFFSEQKVAKEVPAVSEVTGFDTFCCKRVVLFALFQHMQCTSQAYYGECS